MGERGKAKRIDFAPLQAVPVPLPAGGVFVIANSLVVSDKKGDRMRGRASLTRADVH